MNEHLLGARHHAKKFPLTIPFKLRVDLGWEPPPQTSIPVSGSGSTHEGQLTSERQGLQTPDHLPRQPWRAWSPSGPVSASPYPREQARAGTRSAEAAWREALPMRPAASGRSAAAGPAAPRTPSLTCADGAYSLQPPASPPPGPPLPQSLLVASKCLRAQFRPI